VRRRDPYQVLCVERGVGDDGLKRAFRRLARQYHPDSKPVDPQAEQRFHEIVEAYALLSDPVKRKAYDRHGGPGLLDDSSSGLGDLGSSLKDFVGGVFSDLLGDSTKTRGKDLNFTLKLTFEEAALGCRRTIAFDGPVICPDCEGIGGEVARSGAVIDCKACGATGRVKAGPSLLGITRSCSECRGKGKIVKIPCKTCAGNTTVTRTRRFSIKVPCGTKDGSLRVVTGKGCPGVDGGEPGDLLIVIRVDEHPLLKLKDGALVCEVPISPMEAAVGGSVPVPTLDGVVHIQVPPGSRDGKVMKLAGKGMPERTGSRGDILIRFHVETPVNLTKEQQEAMERLLSTMTKRQLPKRFDFHSEVDKLMTSKE